MYDSNTGIVSKPGISIYDLQRALGASSTNLIALCRHPGINVYAKYKSVNYSTEAEITEVQRREAGYGVEGTKFNIGGGENVWESMFIEAKKGNVWRHKPPTGGAPNNCRLLDFNGYNANAKIPMAYNRDGGDNELLLNIFWDPQNLPEGNLKIDDLTKIVGVDINHAGLGFLYRVRNSSVINHIPGLDSTNHIIYPVKTGENYNDGPFTIISKNSIVNDTTYEVLPYIVAASNDNCYVTPLGVIEEKVKGSSTSNNYSLQFNAYTMDSRGTVYLDWTVKATSSITPGTLYVYIYATPGSYDLILVKSFEIPAISAGSSHKGSYSLTDINQDLSYETGELVKADDIHHIDILYKDIEIFNIQVTQ